MKDCRRKKEPSLVEHLAFADVLVDIAPYDARGIIRSMQSLCSAVLEQV